MVNNLIDAISIKLNKVFGKGYAVYAETTEQGLKEPFFLIAALNASTAPLLGRRYYCRHDFDVRYFPAQKGSIAEMLDIAGELYEALAYAALPSGDLVRGTKMRYEPKDGVLHFFVSFDMVLTEETARDIMETVTVRTGKGV